MGFEELLSRVRFYGVSLYIVDAMRVYERYRGRHVTRVLRVLQPWLPITKRYIIKALNIRNAIPVSDYAPLSDAVVLANAHIYMVGRIDEKDYRVLLNDISSSPGVKPHIYSSYNNGWVKQGVVISSSEHVRTAVRIAKKHGLTPILTYAYYVATITVPSFVCSRLKEFVLRTVMRRATHGEPTDIIGYACTGVVKDVQKGVTTVASVLVKNRIRVIGNMNEESAGRVVSYIIENSR